MIIPGPGPRLYVDISVWEESQEPEVSQESDEDSVRLHL